MDSFIKMLKEQTAHAIKQGEKAAALKAKKKEEAEAKKKLAEEAKARKIVNQIPERANYESKQGRSHAIVMSFKEGDYTRPPNETDFRKCGALWLKGVAKLVHEYCENAGLKPTIEAWWTDDGWDSGYNIVIHW